MKVCSKCHIEKDESGFNKNQRWCRPCARAAKRNWYQENASGVSSYNKDYRAENKKMVKTLCKKWHEENREYANSKALQNYYRNRDEMITRAAQWNKSNRAQYRVNHNKCTTTKRAEMADWYIRDLIFKAYGLTDPPKEFIDFYRGAIVSPKRHYRKQNTKQYAKH